jgi:hypothetical protein
MEADRWARGLANLQVGAVDLPLPQCGVFWCLLDPSGVHLVADKRD